MYKFVKQEYKEHKKLKYLIVICVCLICLFRFWLLNTFRDEDFIRGPATKTRQGGLSIHEPNRTATNIFFVEPSCLDGGGDGEVVSPRHACAVESAARANPDRRVYLLHTCALDRYNLPSEQDHVSRLLALTNVRLLRLDTTRFVRGTPLEGWTSARFTAKQVGDLLGLVALWKYGGTYMGLDFVVLKSLNGLSNFVGAESERSLSTSVVNFEPSGIGHEIATNCLEEAERSLNGSVWRVLRSRCGVSEPAEMTRDRCRGFSVLPPPTFYPISRSLWQLHLASNATATDAMRQSIAVHTWNMLPLRVSCNSAHAMLAQRYCPAVYRSALACGL